MEEGRGIMAMLMLLLFALIASSPSFISGDGDGEDFPHFVLELTDETFQDAINKYDHVFVDFYAPWCGHCRMLSPEMDAAAPRLAENEPPVVLAKVNAEKYTRLASQYHVSGYPTLKLFTKGIPSDYRGPRQASPLIAHLTKAIGPDWISLDTDSEVKSFVEKAGNAFPFFVAFGVESSAVMEVAKKYKNRAWFVVVSSLSKKAFIDDDGDDMRPSIVALHPQYNEHDVFYGPFEGTELADFIRHHLLPLVNELTPGSLRLLKEDGRPIALTIMRNSPSDLGPLKAVASINHGFVFAYLDAGKWSDFSASFHITGKSPLPIFLVWDGNSEYFMSSRALDFSMKDPENYIAALFSEFREGTAERRKIKGPSFMDFLKTTIAGNSVFIIVFTVAIVMLYQSFSGSSDNTEPPPQRGAEIAEGTQYSQSLNSGSVQSIDDAVNKED